MRSILSQVLKPDRRSVRVNASGRFAHPFLHEQEVGGPIQPPFVVSTMRGGFMSNTASLQGVVRSGFTSADPKEESHLLQVAFEDLFRISLTKEWSNRCNSIPDALIQMRLSGMDPSSLVVPFEDLPEVCGQPISLEESKLKMLHQGYVAEVEGVQVLGSSLPLNTAILTSTPEITGQCIRVGSSIAVTFYQADKSIILVGNVA